MCALIKNELGLPLEAEREEDWENVLGSNQETIKETERASPIYTLFHR